MDFRRRALQSANAARATTAQNEDTPQTKLSRKELLSAWRDERCRGVLQPRGENNVPVSTRDGKAAVASLDAAPKMGTSKKRVTLAPSAIKPLAATPRRRTAAARRSSERVIKGRRQSILAEGKENSMLQPVFTPGKCTPARSSGPSQRDTSPGDYAVDLVVALRSQLAEKDAAAAALQRELDAAQEQIIQLEATLDRERTEQLQALRAAHAELERLQQPGYNAEDAASLPAEEPSTSPLKSDAEDADELEQRLADDMVPRAELTEAVFARELAEARLKEAEDGAQELEQYVSECASMIEELVEKQAALQIDIDAKSEHMDALMHRCMVAEFRITEVDELMRQRDEMATQLRALQTSIGDLIGENGQLRQQVGGTSEAPVEARLEQHDGNQGEDEQDDVCDMSIFMDDTAAGSVATASVQTQTDTRWRQVMDQITTLLEENRLLRVTIERDANTYREAVATLTKRNQDAEREWKEMMESDIKMRQETMECLAQKVKRCQELSSELKTTRAAAEAYQRRVMELEAGQLPSADESGSDADNHATKENADADSRT
ncbi:hypothetical protein THASP1DRAFT_31127 [Thamnocephalis sphaerospora]|uniref:Uncharacterized protein n=1 Tax=Thamnocephalis sphaerospora TaxID=78915 RepID=A0A4V1IWC3_9FUNG|nr:hypothetical protein THASP1DRAFT_31127 [Thamnocephalis sphaerospora]|eukprot:RKP07059.1 hypothetical protein THASP1DRAFT_31127 [Thamnocephalis sphaerospora]